MTAAWNWIKAGFAVAFVVLYLLLRMSEAENQALQTKLDTAEDANKTTQETIETLRSSNSDMNELLVKRQLQHNQTEAQRDADIEELKQQLTNKKCYSEPWPDDVARKLREPY